MQLDPLSLSEITTHLSNVTVSVRVLTVGIRTIQYQDGECTIYEGRFGDETGTFSYTAWQDFDFEPGDSIIVGNVMIYERNGRPELNLDESSWVAMADDPIDTDAKIGGDSDLTTLSPGDCGQNIEVTVEMIESRTIETQNCKRDVLSGVLADGTERLRFIDWDPHAAIKTNASYRIEDVYVRGHSGSSVINISESSIIRPLSKLIDTTPSQAVLPEQDEIPCPPVSSVSYDSLSFGETIGGGGDTIIKKATYKSENQATLAIKQPSTRQTLTTDQCDQMLREAENWDHVDNHDHIVEVVDYDSNPLPWIAMEYMDGGDLSQRAEELGFNQALWTALAITEGVSHAHDMEIAHFDLRPENILFNSIENAWDVPKVADWGLSKNLPDNANSIDADTQRYAAPEQFHDEYGSTDFVTDIYQLGTVFYELFTGEPAFDGKNFNLNEKSHDKSPTPPSEIVDVPSKLDDILLTALAEKKNDRYKEISILRDELQALFDSTVGAMNSESDALNTIGKSDNYWNNTLFKSKPKSTSVENRPNTPEFSSTDDLECANIDIETVTKMNDFINGIGRNSKKNLCNWIDDNIDFSAIDREKCLIVLISVRKQNSNIEFNPQNLTFKLCEYDGRFKYLTAMPSEVSNINIPGGQTGYRLIVLDDVLDEDTDSEQSTDRVISEREAKVLHLSHDDNDLEYTEIADKVGCRVTSVRDILNSTPNRHEVIIRHAENMSDPSVTDIAEESGYRPSHVEDIFNDYQSHVNNNQDKTNKISLSNANSVDVATVMYDGKLCYPPQSIRVESE